MFVVPRLILIHNASYIWLITPNPINARAGGGSLWGEGTFSYTSHSNVGVGRFQDKPPGVLSVLRRCGGSVLKLGLLLMYKVHYKCMSHGNFKGTCVI